LIAILSIFLSDFVSTATAPTELYTLSLHDALPILGPGDSHRGRPPRRDRRRSRAEGDRVLRVRSAHHRGVLRRRKASERFLEVEDRKSTRLNSSHVSISYAVFCLKKKKKKKKNIK